MRAWGWLLSFVAITSHAELPDVISASLTQAQVPASNVAVYVQRVDATTPLIDHQSGSPFIPASTMKLLTTYAGLSLLGADYRWRTELLSDGEVSNGTLNGNLILKGYGDPALMAEQYWAMLRHLRQIGIKDIHGDFVVDSTWFYPAKDNPGAFDGEPYRPYNALPSATVVNLRSNSFRFMPDLNQPGKVNIAIDPNIPEIHVKNSVELVDGECGDWRNKIGFKIQPLAATDKLNEFDIEFNGVYPASCGEKSIELSMLDDAAYAFYLFRNIWQQLGGSVSGTLYRTLEPMAGHALVTQYSLPLADVIRPLNKFSNNLMARQLLLTIAAEKGQGIPNEVAGASIVQSWLASKGMSFSELQIENGSGLSRNARISARSMATFLRDAYYSPVMPEFMASLPVIGIDGTLSKRLSTSAVKGRAHLKTGTINGVSALAGYVLDKQGRYWVVVFMANHAAASAARDTQDTLIEWIYSQN